MSELNLCPVCGGILQISYTFTLEQCMPRAMSHSPVSEGQRLCSGHPDTDGRMLTTDNCMLLLESFLSEGLHAEGKHHKQYALYKVAEVLGLTQLLEDIEDKGIAP